MVPSVRYLSSCMSSPLRYHRTMKMFEPRRFCCSWAVLSRLVTQTGGASLGLSGMDRKKEVNLLFCGHFSEMQEEDYVAKVKELLASPEGAVEALTRDLYQMGVLVHQKKFRFLGNAYTVCALGLLLTALLALLGRWHLI